MNRLMNNKYKGVIITAFVILLAVLSLTVINIGLSFVKSSSEQIPNRTVEGLSFENAKIETANGISKYTVDVINDLEENIKLKTIEIKLKDENGAEITNLIGYIGDYIEPKESKILEISIDEEINILPQVEYIIHK